MSLRQHTGSTISNVTYRDIARMGSNSDRSYPSKHRTLSFRSVSVLTVSRPGGALPCWMVKAAISRNDKTYTEDDIQAAIAYYRAGHHCNISQIANKFGVKRCTLRNRLQGIHGPASHSQQDKQHLTDAEEHVLCDWIEYRSETGHPLSKQTLLHKVEEVLGAKPSPKWYRRLLSRHPHIQLGKPSGLDPKHAQCFNQATINQYFQELGQVLDEKKIPWCNVYNMDEKGCQRGGGRRMQAIKYFVPRNRRPNYKLRSANLELVTIIECVCADGTSLLPGFIFPGKEFHPEWFMGVDERIRQVILMVLMTRWLIFASSVGMSENGWTDDFLCTQWFRESFIPQATARNTSEAPILLIYDGHGSHTTEELRQYAEENKIELFCLPPHTTHRTQPLDVGVFGPLQRRWMERCDEVLAETGEEIRKVDFIKEYMVARELAFLPETIQKAWQKCGICPLKPDIFADADFAPSASTSTRGHFPASYPASNDDTNTDSDTEGQCDDEDCGFVSANTPSQYTPPPPSIPLTTSKKRKCADIEAENTILKAKLAKVSHEKEAALMHAKMAQLEVKEMALKINAKKKKKDKLPTMEVPKARWLTGQKGKEQWEAVRVQNEARRQKKAEAEAEKSKHGGTGKNGGMRSGVWEQL